MVLHKEAFERLTREYKESQFFGVLEHPDITIELTNPSCGDAISFSVAVQGDRIKDIRFQGVGCIINQGTASLLCARVVGALLEDLLKITESDVLALINLQLGPTRLRCATLPLQALQAGIKNYVKG